MKKLSEYKDEEALDLLADLLEPVVEILGDTKVVKEFQDNRLKGISLAIKCHKRAVFKAMAVLNGVDVDSYHCDILTLPKTILDIVNDKDLIDFFSLQSRELGNDFFGSATMTGEEEVSKGS